MKVVYSLAVFLALIAVVIAKLDKGFLNLPIHDEEFVNQINTHPRNTWKATTYPFFANKTLKHARRLLGAILAHPETDRTPRFELEEGTFNAPETFDARQKWPQCIHPIRDQQQCGSCWAFSASEVLSDRFCIASSGKTNVVLSPEYIVECDSSDYGCDGGILSNVWHFLSTHGVSTDSCTPYTSGNGQVASCPRSCKDGQSLKLYKSKEPKHLRGISTIENELVNNGPVQVAFSVYRDFMSYKSGVYRHVSGGLLGGHAVKAVGWGVDQASKLPYWIIANSWGPSWGMNGFFWILKGKNECGIEDDVWAGLADL